MTRRKAETDDAPDLEDDAGGAGADDATAGDGGGAADDDLESHIRRVVSEVVSTVLGDRPAGGAGGAGTSAAQDEGSIRRMVREAQESLRKEEEKDSRFKSVADTVETLKAAVEKPPARAGIGGRLQSWMWGAE